MILADFITELFGWGCFVFFVLIWVIGMVICKIGKAVGGFLSSEDVKETARIGLLAWFFSMFDD